LRRKTYINLKKGNEAQGEMFEEKNLEKGIENGVRKKQKGRMREE
jgi:hypothetical protein